MAEKAGCPKPYFCSISSVKRNSNKNRDNTTTDQKEEFEFRKFSNTPEKRKANLEACILIVNHVGDPSATNWNIRKKARNPIFIVPNEARPVI